MAGRKPALPVATEPPRPKLFIGSSSESLKIAKVFLSELLATGLVTPVGWWSCRDFTSMTSTLDGLLAAADRFDFGLFLFTPDDRFESRDEAGMMARDNVLFEAGLFLGNLGKGRTFAVVQGSIGREKKVRIPVDLQGITIPRFKASSDPETMRTYVTVAVANIIPEIEEQGFRDLGLHPIKKHGDNRKERAYEMTISAEEINSNLKVLDGGELILVAYRVNPGVPYLRENRIVVGTPRVLAGKEIDDFLMTVSLKGLCPLKKDDTVHCRLVLVPRGATIDGATCLLDMKKSGCHLLGGGGKDLTANWPA